MKKLSTFFISLALLAGLAAPVFAPMAAQAATNTKDLCEGSGGKWDADASLPNGGSCKSSDGRTVTGTLQQLTDVLIFLVGAIAVVMIIVGGLRYVTSSGDQNSLSGAKNTILYAVIGLIVAFMAYAIVHFVFAAFNIK